MTDAPPCPPLPYEVELPVDAGAELDLTPLPARPGVFAFEDGDGHTLCLATSANVRRLVRARLTAPIERTRRVDYRATTRRVLATTVGSAFEADWAYLQHARARLPNTYATLLDRWRAWFVHCDPDTAFPRFTRTALPGRVPASGTLLGPARDRSAAQAYAELLERLFDLCRYHDVLVQTPNGTACAYKDMGRCPAPCDGTVGMDAYRAQIRDAIAFASGGADAWRASIEADMKQASADLEFERAERLKRRLDEAAPAASPGFARMDRLERFRWIAIMPAGRSGWRRVFAIVGGWIAPIVDVAEDIEPEMLTNIVRAVADRPIDVAPSSLENVGLVSHHLHDGREGTFMRADAALTIPADALRAESSQDEPQIADRTVEAEGKR